MRKKILGIGAALTAACLVTAGCGGGSGGDSDSKSITVMSIWHASDPEGKILNDVVTQLGSKGINVKVIEGGETLADTFDTSFAANKEPDVAIVNLAEKTNDWVKNGEVVPASEYLDTWGLTSKIKPEALAEWKDADGKVQGFPYVGFVWPVWYNTELLAKAGVTDIPKTTDDLIAAAGKLRAAGIGPLVVGGKDWSGQKLFLQIAQSYMTADEARTVYAKGGYCDSPAAMRGIQLFTRLRDAGVFADDVEGLTADQMNASFFAGKSAVMSAGSWAFAPAPAALVPNIQLGGLPVPAGGTYAEPTAYRGFTGSGFWVSRNGKKKIDAVKEFVTAFYDPAVVDRFAAEANTVTAGVSSGDVQAKNALMKTAVTELDSKVKYALMPDTVVPGKVADPMIRATSSAFIKGNDANKICKSLDQLYS
ncbi:ABC transporter substrate-binding protein [Mangrovihabitans endophyticus]|uniref:ABC transporter substrate-binding protein n=1 Tax=Mangrovihabitans endophyticus TaxID=1751298 RepID=A0A8J3BXI9_9ACTN|nr:ABC transporter substrate-binding protein [Mangrovihabitans endophyticus]GGK78502.1 ABC transporter substrate-binding protein [Mangrovihabitans endophyticus]